MSTFSTGPIGSDAKGDDSQRLRTAAAELQSIDGLRLLAATHGLLRGVTASRVNRSVDRKHAGVAHDSSESLERLVKAGVLESEYKPVPRTVVSRGEVQYRPNSHQTVYSFTNLSRSSLNVIRDLNELAPGLARQTADLLQRIDDLNGSKTPISEIIDSYEQKPPVMVWHRWLNELEERGLIQEVDTGKVHLHEGHRQRVFQVVDLGRHTLLLVKLRAAGREFLADKSASAES